MRGGKFVNFEPVRYKDSETSVGNDSWVSQSINETMSSHDEATNQCGMIHGEAVSL